MTAPREIIVLGSTGSVGTQALDVVRAAPERFRVVGLAAGGGHVELLAEQALEFGVRAVAVSRASAAQDLQLAFYAAARREGFSQGRFRIPRILAGPDAVTELATGECDVVLNAVVGSLGLRTTLATLDAGRTLALANKESLVAGGRLVLDRAAPGQIVPVDSEHSALAQCLRGGAGSEVRRLVLTASGGPFRGRSRAELAGVTVAQAMAHPTWTMGQVITLNSATLVNKGLELIEANLLFGIDYDAIEVVVHPQSIVHSMVEFHDGATIAQAGPPDMRLPISLALGWPDRVPGAATGLDWTTASDWRFEPLDDDAFPAVRLARQAGIAAGCVPATYNAANEEAVAAFVAGRLPFLGIVDTISQVVSDAPRIERPTIDDILDAERWARKRARDIVDTAGHKSVTAIPTSTNSTGSDR